MENTSRTVKNRIGKRQRMECFLNALPDFLKASEKYKPKPKITVVETYERIK